MIRIVQWFLALSPHKSCLRRQCSSVIVSSHQYIIAMVAQLMLGRADAAAFTSRLFKYFIFLSRSTFLLFIGFIFYASARADTSVSHDSGLYVGGRAGYSYNDRSCVDVAIVCDRDDSGVGIFAGYDINPAIALEWSFNDLGDTAAVYPNITLDGKIQSTDISLIYSREFYKKTTLFGKLGAAYWQAEVVGWGSKLDDDGVSPLVGGGLQVPLFNQRKLYARLEYQYVDRIGNREMGYANAHFFSAGLFWHFGAVKSSPSPRAIETAPNINAAIPETPPTPAQVIAAEPEVSEPALIIDEQAGTPLFAVGSSTIQNTDSIDAVVSILTKNPNANVLILGHTDSQGSATNNLRLSTARAQAVADYLMRQGIASERIQTQGMGEEAPLTDNLSAASRAKNRRVEFVFSNMEKR